MASTAAQSSNATHKPVACVFCGASPGKSEAHMKAAKALAHALHRHSYSLVYGGGTAGLMGEVARTLVSLSGPDSVHGIIPTALMQYEAKADVDQSSDQSTPSNSLIFGRKTEVPDMHTRKALMAKEVQEGGPGSGFVALSGGFGTMEELMEVTTWNQLGIHAQPVVLFDVEGYWAGLVAWIKQAVEAGFITPGNSGIVRSGVEAEGVIKELKEYQVSEGRLKLDWNNN